MKIHKRSKGFTLIEMLIVLVIIGLLAALVGPKFFGQEKKAKQRAAKAQISLFETALDTYQHFEKRKTGDPDTGAGSDFSRDN